jgi:murein DD-endopeptidase
MKAADGTKLRLFADIMGLSPLPVRLRQAKTAIFGEEDVPPSKAGLSSLKQLYPRISPTLWRGKAYLPKTVIISNLVNHTPTPIEDGWSVKKTQTLDFRGGKLTYNSHNGTDFAVPVGSVVCTAAPGRVVAVFSEFNRGGLKIVIDHGRGLKTCYAHLAKSLVREGDVLHRAQPIALSGYSGIDGAFTFPFGIPHIHFNVWLNGTAVDPFPHGENQSLWAGGYLPAAVEAAPAETEISPYDEEKVNRAISVCKTPSARERLLSYRDLIFRGARLVIEMNYYPTRFSEKINPYNAFFGRMPRLDLPFRASDFEKVVFLDEL